MSGRRTDMHRIQDLIRLHRRGRGIRAIARQLGMGRDTVRGYLKRLAEVDLLAGDPEVLPDVSVLHAALVPEDPAAPASRARSSVERWREAIAARLTKRATPTAIHDWLRVEYASEFTGSLSAVKRMCARLRREQGVEPTEVAIPVETAPGEVAQVDFGYAGKLLDPERNVVRRAWVFVLVLGYSRHMVADIVFDQKQDTWLSLHADAFRALGGVPRVLVPDNLKTAVVRAAFGVNEKPALNRSYREFARHYGFEVDPTPPLAPEKKGKVERAVQYVKRSFLAPRDLSDIRDARRELQVWLNEVAGKRRHGTTGKRPKECFEGEEKMHLHPLPDRPHERVVWKAVRVHRDAHVQIDGTLYSAPWRFLHRELWAKCTANSVFLYHDDDRVATHRRAARGRRVTEPEHLPHGRRDLADRSRSHWVRRAAKIGLEAERFVTAMFASDDVLSQLRGVQAIVTHLETFPRDRALAACRRAHHFRSYSYMAIKNILRKGLDLEAWEPPKPRAWATDSRFARSPAEVLFPLKEV
jgi:transposase